MSDFLTELPIDGKWSVGDIMSLCVEWLNGMPRGSIKVDVSDLPSDGTRKFGSGAEQLEVACVRDEQSQMAGFRYVSTDEKGIIWCSEVVASKSEEFWLSIRVLRNSDFPTSNLPTPRKPYLLKLLIARGWAATDGGMPISDQPTFVGINDVQHVAELMRGDRSNRMPVVYVSKSRSASGGYATDPSHLAKKLAGLAHVMVEDDSRISRYLARVAGYKNSYDGAVGVYWPDGVGRRIYMPDMGDSSSISHQVLKDVVHALSNRRQLPSCTWTAVKEKISIGAIAKLRSEGSSDINKYVEAFDAELKAKNERLREAEEEVRAIKLRLRSQAAEGGVLQQGKERDLFADEIKGVLLGAIREAIARSGDGTRRKHLLQDILEANQSISLDREEMEKDLKSMFKDYKKLTPEIKSSLSDMGFDISDDGKHYKLVFSGDGRYTFSLPKTPGDHRSGKNLASNIIRALL